MTTNKTNTTDFRALKLAKASIDKIYELAKQLRCEPLTDEERLTLTKSLCDEISLTRDGLGQYIRTFENSEPFIPLVDL